MSRSICDYTKSVWVLPQPDVLTFTVGPSAHLRAVLASDGLWDVVSFREASAIVCAAPTAQEVGGHILASPDGEDGAPFAPGELDTLTSVRERQMEWLAKAALMSEHADELEGILRV